MRTPLLLFALFWVITVPVLAAERWPVGDAAGAAYKDGAYGVALAALRRELDLCEASKPTADECLNLLFWLGDTSSKAANLRASEAYWRRALGVAERALPAGDPDIATSYSNLALNLTAQGRAADAEPLIRWTLAIDEATLSPGHSDVAWDYANLASNLEAQGRGEAAEPLIRRALAMRRQLAATHPDRIAGYWTLAANLQSRRRSAPEVRSLYRSAGAGALERMQSFTGFTPAAQAELRKYRPIFTGQVRGAWDLSVGAK